MRFDEYWRKTFPNDCGDLSRLATFVKGIGQGMWNSARAEGRRSERELVLDEVVEILEEGMGAFVGTYRGAEPSVKISTAVKSRIAALRDVERATNVTSTEAQ